MYFPEVDVDVRPRPRSDEPDFSHIKSSEDISSGYSSADNSASLTRTASLGAAARARGRSRTAVTSIKRPQAAEESEVIIEELQDDDSFEYSNMPALINLPSNIFLSHTQPPFIYQYVGDQVKILQVLGNYPFNASVNNQTNNNTDHWDQKEVTTEETSLIRSVINERLHISDGSLTEQEASIKKVNTVSDIPTASQHKENNDNQSSTNDEDNIVYETALDNMEKESVDTATKEELAFLDQYVEASLDTSPNDNDSVESDDEASFGTPEDSPKSKRKFPKGKNKKGKAPPPPTVEANEVTSDHNKVSSHESDTSTNLKSLTSRENLIDIVNNLPNTSIKESGSFKNLQVVNPIAENKRRHKSKSPARIPKGSSSGIGKLLHLPGKLAFWHKNEDKAKSDETSISSDDHSRRSSTVENAVDDYQSCSELNTLSTEETNVSSTTTEVSQSEKSDDQISFKDASDLEGEGISQEIIEKSDALQKLIDAKIAGHPEYKFISLHDEIPSSSKSTDV